MQMRSKVIFLTTNTSEEQSYYYDLFFSPQIETCYFGVLFFGSRSSLLLRRPGPVFDSTFVISTQEPLAFDVSPTHCMFRS